MANHISNSIQIKNGNASVLKEVERVFHTNEGEYDVGTEELAQRVYGDEYPGEYERSWIVENCGAKWFNGTLEEAEEDYISIQIESAWDPPSDWIVKLTEKLVVIKEDVIVINTYEDEGFNFVGVHLCAKHEDEHMQLDMDKYDLENIWENDDERDRLYDDQAELRDELESDYASTLLDMKENPEDYE
jgi:hypothetical protein